MTTATVPRIWLEMKLVDEARAVLEGAAEPIGPGAGADSGASRHEAAVTANGIEAAEAVIAGPRVLWDAARFECARRVKVVARTGIGFDNIDLAAATAAGVCVTNTPDAPTESTAEFTVGLMLCLARRLCVADRRFRTEGWLDASELLGVELAGKTLGLVGFGRIGSRVAEIALALRMKIIAHDPLADAAVARGRGVEIAGELSDMLAVADIVSLHIPLTPRTRGLIGAGEFARMKRGAMLINAARGPIVVEAALLDALKSGHLAGAAVDVWDPEPALPDNPLLRLDNVVAMPHIASATSEGRRRNHVGAVECALMVLRGARPPSLLNPEVWGMRR